VTDNAPYQNVQIHATRKADMINWLHEKNIIFDRSMLKPQLYELIKINKKRHIRSWREKRLEMALIQISVPARENYRVIKGF
jgi:hypothetical protein